MRLIARLIIVIASSAAVAAAWPTATYAQRHRPPAGRAQPRHPIRGSVVFVGGYFYDPFFGPYPWWSRHAYPFPYYPVYDNRAIVRVIATPKDALVYVDGFYAGTVHDFNDWFQGLPLPPGGHEIVLFLDGYRTIRDRVYLAPASTFRLHHTLEPLSAGECSEPPAVAPPIPPPPAGTFTPPRTQRPIPPPAGSPAPPVAARGTLSLRVQPADAEVAIDGDRWASSDGSQFVIQIPAGAHRIDVARRGYRTYSADIEIRDGETMQLNVSLAPDQS